MKLQKIRNRLFKTFARTIASLLFLLFLIVFLLNLSVVQTYFAQKATTYLSEKTGYEISIDKISISWLDEVEAHRVHAVDKNGNQLFDVHSLHIDYDLIHLIKTGKIELDYVTLFEPEFTAGWYKGEELISLSQFVRDLRELFIKPSTNKKPKIKPFHISGGKIVNGTFHYFDSRKDSSDRSNYFDYNYFTLDSIFGDVTNFITHFDTISFDAKNVVANHTGSKLDVKHLDTKFFYCGQQLLMQELYAEVGKSVLKDSLSLEYNSPTAFSSFNDSVKILANLNESIIHTEDLEVFAPQVNIFNDVWTLSGDFRGFVNDFRIDETSLSFGENSVLNGNVGFTGLPNISETLLNLQFTTSRVFPKDIKQYIRNDGFYNQGIVKLGETNFEGNFRGFINNFVSHGNFNTKLGFLSTDVNFVINKENPGKTSYSGRLRTDKFKLGEFIGVRDMGRVNMNVRIKRGSYGFPLKAAKISLEGTVKSIEYKKYTYKNIELDAAVAANQFNGLLIVDDPNLRLKTTHAKLDLNKGELDIKGEINKVNFQQLGLTQDSAFVKGNIMIDINGFDAEDFNIDDLRGKIVVDDGKAFFGGRKYELTDFVFDSQIDSKHGRGKNKGNIEYFRTFDIQSDFFDMNIKGNFTFKEIVKDFPVLVQEYILFFENDKEATQKHYAAKDPSVQNYTVNLIADLKNVDGLIELIDSNIKVSNHTKIIAELKRGYSTVFNFNTSPNYFKYKEYEFFENEIDINTSKLVDTTSALGSIYVKSKRQKISGVNYLENTDILVNIEDANVNFAFKTNQENTSNHVFLKGKANFFKDSVSLNLGSSYFHLLGENWNINNENKITIASDFVEFHKVTFKNEKQILSLEGVLSSKEEDNLKIKVRDFDSRNLQSITPVKIGGIISGDVELYDAFHDIELKSKVLIDNLSIMGDTLGKVRGKVDWIEHDQKILLDVDLIRDNLIITHAKGSYDGKNTSSPFDIDLTVDKADFSILETFLMGYVTNVKGSATGFVNLSGTVDRPNWQGKIDLVDAGFKMDYFQTSYEFANEILFDKEHIYVKNLHLIDSFWKTKMVVNGGISHHWFKNFSTSTVLDMKKTFVMNTKAKDNTLYYGTAFATGKVSIDGPFENLKIWSEELKTNQGTYLYVPLEEPDKIARKDYITFFNEEDELSIQSDENDLSTSGIEMDINFNITPDALFEIIFDANAGDKIKGQGRGLINMKIDTRGGFNMFGTYDFKEGSYNFTLIDLINKKFDIAEGSKISWDGDPYQGDLSIAAVYRQHAALSNVIVDSTLRLSSEAQRKIPVDIILDLSGKLLAPDVNFKIKINDYPPSLETVVADVETRMTTDDQFRNKQVFSLIVLKQFSQEQNIGNLGTGTQQNLSELFSNQFSSWVSQFDENLDVAIDFSGYDPENNNIFRLKLSYSLLDGRLRVSRDGGFSNYESSNDLAHVFGEWTIEYLITEDGKIRMKAFNKNLTSTISQDNATTNTVYGFSLTHNKSFDSLKELFKKAKNKLNE